jgi:short-subunit dehydrogenase
MRDRQLTVYAATKAFALVFADALWVELMSEITANLIPTGPTA